MPKKLICLGLVLTILILMPRGAVAEEKVVGEFFTKNIKINGELIINYELQNSFFMHNNSVYMPLTPDFAKICGLEIDMDWNSNTLKLTKTKSTETNITDRWTKNDRNDINTKVINNAEVYVYSEVEQDANVFGLLSIGKEKLDLNGLPLLANEKNVFIPVKALADSKNLVFDVYYDNYYGLYISTEEGVPAKEYFYQGDADYFEGLAKYIQANNKNLTGTQALNYVYMFKRAGTVYGVNETLLMALAQRESRFNPSAIAAGGAVGMMQIMPKTARTYGISYSQLLDAKISIEFGAMYISNAIIKYDGDVIKGLSAYNQGGGTVDRGSYSTSFAYGVLANQNDIIKFVNNGNF